MTKMLLWFTYQVACKTWYKNIIDCHSNIFSWPSNLISCNIMPKTLSEKFTLSRYKIKSFPGKFNSVLVNASKIKKIENFIYLRKRQKKAQKLDKTESKISAPFHFQLTLDKYWPYIAKLHLTSINYFKNRLIMENPIVIVIKTLEENHEKNFKACIISHYQLVTLSPDLIKTVT